MLKNYLIISLRNLWKHKTFTGLNIFGLSLSMSICLVLILLVYDHFQYDKFHPHGDTTYRITTYKKGAEGLFDEAYATSSLPFKNRLVADYSFIKTGTNLNHRFAGEIRSPHKILDIDGEIARSLFADEYFFEVFGFELQEGDPKTALKEPYSIVLDTELAQNLFPNESALGQTVDFEDHGSYKITGIVAPVAANSHIAFKALASFSTYPVLVDKGIYDEGYKDWENIWSNYNYLVLNSESDRAETERLINEVASSNLELDDDHSGYTFRLQALSEIVPGRPMSNEIAFALPSFVLAFFGLLGFIVLVTASINYTNLSIAKALSRTKEIGIRKVNGASGKQIVSQFLVESTLMAVISLVLAVVIYKFLIGKFNQLWIFNFIGVALEDTMSAYGYFIIFTLLLGLLTGIGPAIFLSRLKAINSLKGSLGKIKGKKKSIGSYLFGKRTLISVQFTLSILMLVSILILNKQASYLVNAEYGFNETEVFFIKTHEKDPALIAEHFGSLASVLDISFTSHHPAVGRSHGDHAKLTQEQEPITLYDFDVDASYIDVMGLDLIAGKNFPEGALDENEKFIILNERAVEALGFESPSHAIGEIVYRDSLSVSVVGVVKDYHWEPLMNSIRPLALRIRPDRYEYAYLKVGGGDFLKTKSQMEEAWIDFDPAREFEGAFLDEQLDEFYQFFFDIGNILIYVASIALSITALGFLGMVSFELKTRIKEIGIRKVLGASFQSLTFSMSKGFIIMIMITSLVAIPFGIWINSLWVYEMAFYAPLDMTIILPTVIIVSVIAALTIISQVWINANKNPTETLRAE